MTYQERCDRIADLIDENLGIRGKSLEGKLGRAGRLLPKYIRRDGAVLIDAMKLEGSPKLARMIDDAEVHRAYGNCENYLSGIDPWVRRKNNMISFLSTNALNLIVITGAVIGVLVWRDLI